MRRKGIIVIAIIVATAIVGFVIGQTARNDPKVTTTPNATISPIPSTAVDSGSPLPSTAAGFCATSDLSLAVRPTDAGAGSRFYDLSLTNTGDASCKLAGFPGLSLVDGSGTQVGPDADRETGSRQAVITILPGSSVAASFRLPIAQNFTDGSCGAPSSHLRVYPPGNTTALTADLVAQACPGWSVQAVRKP